MLNVSYRVADHLEGPYRRPAKDVLCEGFHYGAREFSDGKRHYLLPSAWEREARSDAPGILWYSGGYVYAGSSATVQELGMLPDGSLEVRYPSLLDNVRGVPVSDAGTFDGLSTFGGEWEVGPGRQEEAWLLSGSCAEGAARALIASVAGDFWLRCDLCVREGTGAAGLLLRCAEGGQHGYLLRLDFHKLTLSLWHYPMEWVVARAMAQTSLPDLRCGGSHEAKILMHGSLLDAYLDGRHIFSRAVYDYRDGQLGFFVEDGEATFSGFEVFGLAEP